MRPIPRHVLAALTAIAVATGLLFTAGCGKDKNTIVGPGGPRYPALTSPENVLIAMTNAYTDKDTVEIKLVYDQYYEGSSLDQTIPSPTPATFTKGDEVRHVAAMSVGGASVNMELVPALTRFTEAGDPAGWATIQNPFFQLNIDDTFGTQYHVDLFDETMTFKFIPTTPDSTSPTDTTWKIIRWVEIRN